METKRKIHLTRTSRIKSVGKYTCSILFIFMRFSVFYFDELAFRLLYLKDFVFLGFVEKFK